MRGLRRRSVQLAGALATAALCTVALVTPAVAGTGFEKTSPPPKSTHDPQFETATPTCNMYGSSSGFGILCSVGGGGGKTLAQLLIDAGVDVSEEFCWDDGELPDGFAPPEPTAGPGRWWLHTCLSFDGGVSQANANLSYEFMFLAPDKQSELTVPQSAVIELVTGRGQMPFLQVQTSPTSSPRVNQDVAFSLLCDSSRVDCSQADQGRISTFRLSVGGVTMWAELVHLRVLPEGASRPDREVNCTGAGLARTAGQLDSGAGEDPQVCRYRYEQSSNDAGDDTHRDRYPAQATAYWQIFYDAGSGPLPLGDAYEKTTVNQVRVTEVQTLVVS